MVEERRFLCKECRNIFVMSTVESRSSDRKPGCPKCESSNVIEAPAWSPLGSGANIFEDSNWKYECQRCKHVFKMPIPKSPTEEKGRTCPICSGVHLHLLTAMGAQPLYCG
jgi:Zn finger protein HypA/HybF involved in hydrogenase expression